MTSIIGFEDPFDNTFSPATHLPEHLRQRLENRRNNRAAGLLPKAKKSVVVSRNSELLLSTLDEDTWLSLPDEVTLQCFAYLAIWDLFQVQLVCKLWHRISMDKYVGEYIALLLICNTYISLFLR